MGRRTNTRERMVETAAELFSRQGFHGTGVNQLLAEGGAPKGSLYFHFPGGKEQLATEALTLSAERRRDQLRELAEAAASPGAAVETVVEHLAARLEASDFQHGCPLSTVALDAADNDAIRGACADGFGSWQAVLAELLVDGGLGDADAERLATVVLSAVEGALLLAKTRRDTAPLRAVAEHLRTTIDRELI